jgi:anti-sigma factor RsiW
MADGADPTSDRSLWQRCRSAGASEDDEALFLELAAFADGRLDDEEADRVSALLAADPAAMADVAAARRVAPEEWFAGRARVIRRACALASEPVPAPGRAIRFSFYRSHRPPLQFLAQWGSLAAGILIAGWLGFAMGRDASLALSQPARSGDTSVLPELFDPATGFLRDIGESSRT